MNRLADETSPYLRQHADNPVDWYPWGNEPFVNVKVDREERPDVDAVYMEATQALTGQGGWPMTVFLAPDGRPFFAGTYFPRTRRGGMISFPELLITVMARAEGTGDGSDGKGDEDARLAVETSLDAMASGGIYDHVGGGFARYSVDARWLVPPFEKMLYDQALLVRAYLHAWQVTGHERYLQVVEETIGYVLRDLRHEGGGLFSSEDADSEGVEGKFYVWTPDQVLDALDGDEAWAAEVSAWYGVTPGGNFEGATILNRMHARGELARPERIEEARRRLFAARERRVRPGLDDKVLTEWNGLMLSALAEAAAATGRHDWRDAALAAGGLLVHSPRRGGDGRRLRASA